MMKIMKSISDLYEEQHPLFIQLQKRVDEVFLANKLGTTSVVLKSKKALR
jgi:hypothetical protein